MIYDKLQRTYILTQFKSLSQEIPPKTEYEILFNQ
jgi:hypothetical protein